MEKEQECSRCLDILHLKLACIRSEFNSGVALRDEFVLQWSNPWIIHEKENKGYLKQDVEWSTCLPPARRLSFARKIEIDSTLSLSICLSLPPQRNGVWALAQLCMKCLFKKAQCVHCAKCMHWWDASCSLALTLFLPTQHQQPQKLQQQQKFADFPFSLFNFPCYFNVAHLQHVRHKWLKEVWKINIGFNPKNPYWQTYCLMPVFPLKKCKVIYCHLLLPSHPIGRLHKDCNDGIAVKDRRRTRHQAAVMKHFLKALQVAGVFTQSALFLCRIRRIPPQHQKKCIISTFYTSKRRA